MVPFTEYFRATENQFVLEGMTVEIELFTSVFHVIPWSKLIA